MCVGGGSPDSTLTINQGAGPSTYTSPEQRQAATNAFLARYGMKPNGQPLGTPSDAPDVTDALLKQKSDSESLKLLAQRGSAGTFNNTRQLGDAGQFMLQMPMAKKGG